MAAGRSWSSAGRGPARPCPCGSASRRSSTPAPTPSASRRSSHPAATALRPEGRSLRVLDDEEAVDFAGLVEQAAAAAEASRGQPLFDHLLVDDYQDATFSAERLLAELGAETLVAAGDPQAHVFSFQGTTDAPI